MKKVAMKPITQILYGDTYLQFLKEKSFIGYSFGFEGKNYGQKVELKTVLKDELVGVVATLTINAIQSLEALKNGKNTDKPTA